MKVKYKRPRIAPGSTITAATNARTTYYQTDIKQVLDVLKGILNLFCWKSLDTYGFRCIDFKQNLFGSYVDEDELFICVTDGHDIEVAGELVDPEAAMEEHDISELSTYIRPATPAIIKTYITSYEVSIPNIDQSAKDLLEDGYSFQELVEAYQDLN